MEELSREHSDWRGPRVELHVSGAVCLSVRPGLVSGVLQSARIQGVLHVYCTRVTCHSRIQQIGSASFQFHPELLTADLSHNIITTVQVSVVTVKHWRHIFSCQ